jgi:hypothetical protein
MVCLAGVGMHHAAFRFSVSDRELKSELNEN